MAPLRRLVTMLGPSSSRTKAAVVGVFLDTGARIIGILVLVGFTLGFLVAMCLAIPATAVVWAYDRIYKRRL